MPQNETQKHTLHLREGDWDYITSVYKVKGVSTSLVVRTLVANFVDKLQQKEKPMENIDIKVDL